MKAMKVWLPIAAVVVILIAITTLVVVPRIGIQAKEQSFVGAWVGFCHADSQDKDFIGTGVYTSDGLYITDGIPTFAPYNTTGLGSWVKTGSNTAAFSFMVYGGAEGEVFYYYKVSGVVEYDPETDTTSGSWENHVFSLDGEEIFVETGTCSETRISIDSMSE